MPWLQLHLPVHKRDAERVENALEELGAEAVSFTDRADEPVLEPALGTTPLWQDTLITALFDPTRDGNVLLAALREQTGLALTDSKAEILADQVWERAWMDDFKPLRFGRRLWILPSNSSAPDSTAINLKLDPGLAFGTGTHETTALCLEWIDQAEWDGKLVLDFGCGSGILAIAALLCGAHAAIGCDIDPQALTASHDNALQNDVAGRLTLYPAATMPTQLVDVLLANILAGPLIALASQLAHHTKLGGDLVLSGILVNQAEAVITAYTPWFHMDAPTVRGDWVRLTGRRLSGR